MKVDLAKFEAIIAGLPKRFEDATILAIRDTAFRGVGIVVQEIDEVKAVYNGDLRRSVHANITDRGAILRVDAPHAPIVEFGRRPGRMPPIAPLALWAVRKLGVPEKEAKGIAFLIARKIARDGIKPRHFFRRAMRKIRTMLSRNIRTALDAEFEKAK